MAAAKDEGGRPRGQRILLPEHWGPRPEKEFWGWWERDLRAFITALKGASVWQPRSSSTPLNLLSSKLQSLPPLSSGVYFLEKVNYPRN